MDVLAGFLILGALCGIFVAIQKLNSNVITQVNQNEKIIELLTELKNK
jgi:ADP-ribosylglycohydrolase